MKSEERVRAYLLAVALDAEDEIERRKDDVVLVERMFGLRSGQHGGLAAHEPFIDAVEALRPVMAVEKVREALGSAAGPLRKLAEQTFEDPAIEAYALQVIHHLLALHACQPAAGELAQAIVALQSVTVDR